MSAPVVTNALTVSQVLFQDVVVLLLYQDVQYVHIVQLRLSNT